MQKTRTHTGVLVGSVARGSAFYRAGLRRGDRIARINGETVTDELDFHFSAAADHLAVAVLRDGAAKHLSVDRDEGEASGVELAEQPIRRCANRCVFCFIDQMPPGLRRSLYVKDEDVRLSLFSGNYLTLSTFRAPDLERVVRLGLSPLYISVHATDPDVRRRMLRNARAPDVMEQLRFLARGGIRLHTQIVVCPGYNDAVVLRRSVRDLMRLGDALLSIAVVPVGLTRFHNGIVPPVDFTIASAICREVSRLSNAAGVRDGIRKVFLADEFFIKANLPIPDCAYYEEYPQIENGVGIVRQFIDSWKGVKRKYRRVAELCARRSVMLVTSVSAQPYLTQAAKECSLRYGVAITVVAVVNRLFGETVSVAGLLAATDIIRQIRPLLRRGEYDEVVVPAAMFNYAGNTLDGFSRVRMEKRLGVTVRVAESMEDLLK